MKPRRPSPSRRSSQVDSSSSTMRIRNCPSRSELTIISDFKIASDVLLVYGAKFVDRAGACRSLRELRRDLPRSDVAERSLGDAIRVAVIIGDGVVIIAGLHPQLKKAVAAQRAIT